jgi:hypothetical protein
VKTSAAHAEAAPSAAYDAEGGAPQGAPARRRWERREVSERLCRWDGAQALGLSEREAAEEAGAARSTVRRWVQRRARIGSSERVAEFFESSEGVECLHRILAALQFVVGFLSPSGLRLVCTFLELSGLDAFVASSVGKMHASMSELEAAVVQFGEEQRQVLAAGMSPKEITVCEDETFHPQVCLVAIEPVSDFILLEEYAADRKAETWNAATARALTGLPVTVLQSTSDEATALKAHVAEAFNDANHSPDLFHVQHEASKAMALPLARRAKRAEEEVVAAMTETELVRVAQAAYEAAPRGPGRPPDFEGRLANALVHEKDAVQRFEQANEDRGRARAAIGEISAAYHPYSLKDGSERSPEVVSSDILRALSTLDSIAENAGLPAKSTAGIAKARRVVDAMVDTIRFVHRQTTARLVALGLAVHLHRDVAQCLVPGLYLECAARRAAAAEQRHEISNRARELLEPLQASDHELLALHKGERREIWNVARGCAELFQRSSSCVEGRNGHLALHHHGLHRLPPRKLKALSVVHNFFITRPDGTTPAERFFGAPHEDLFEHILKRLPPPSRPGGKRSCDERRRHPTRGSHHRAPHPDRRIPP